MPTRNVVLTQHHEELISSLVSVGRYQNASEVLRDGLRLIEERDAREAAKLLALRQACDAGFADIDAGGFDDIAESELDNFIGDLGIQAVSLASRLGR